MKNFEELQANIIDWAKERELDTKGTVQGQKMKTIEELAELLIGISKDNKEVIKDSIGDVAVTLIIGNMLGDKLDIVKIYEKISGFFAFKDKGEVISILVNKMQDICFGGYSKSHLLSILTTLKSVAKFYDLEFLDCLESAYNEIANRKGKMIDGTFVKEQDL